MRTITNTEDMINSRDVIERLEDLRSYMAEDEIGEFHALRVLAEHGEMFVDDWEYGAQLIRETFFADYAQQLAEETGSFHVPAEYYSSKTHDLSSEWPFTCIDWERAAKELRVDYSEVIFDGVTYLVR